MEPTILFPYATMRVVKVGLGEDFLIRKNELRKQRLDRGIVANECCVRERSAPLLSIRPGYRLRVQSSFAPLSNVACFVAMESRYARFVHIDTKHPLARRNHSQESAIPTPHCIGLGAMVIVPMTKGARATILERDKSYDDGRERRKRLK